MGDAGGKLEAANKPDQGEVDRAKRGRAARGDRAGWPAERRRGERLGVLNILKTLPWLSRSWVLTASSVPTTPPVILSGQLFGPIVIYRFIFWLLAKRQCDIKY